MIEILQKQCDETKVKIEKLYKLLDSILHVTDRYFTGCEMRSDRTGLSFGVIMNNQLIGSIVLNINDMAIACNKVDDNGNIHATCVRSVDETVPFREEYANTYPAEYKKAARDWFFEISVAPAEFVEEYPTEFEAPVDEPASTTDAGTEVEEVSVEG